MNIPLIEQVGSITVSIVSHLQADLTEGLLADLANYPQVGKVIYIQNLPEKLFDLPEGLKGDRFELIVNHEPKGFGANHNLAFTRSKTPFFCVLNPDVRLPSNPFPSLLKEMSRTQIGLCAPMVVNQAGEVEDSARKFPTPGGLINKIIGLDDGGYRYPPQCSIFFPDWVGGMFMLFRSSSFGVVDGFDEGFFLYYEDVDLCERLRKSGFEIALIPGVQVIHAARRSSRRHLRYLGWHIQSMLRYFGKHCKRLHRAS